MGLLHQGNTGCFEAMADNALNAAIMEIARPKETLDALQCRYTYLLNTFWEKGKGHAAVCEGDEKKE